jgi:hypothetical protein
VENSFPQAILWNFERFIKNLVDMPLVCVRMWTNVDESGLKWIALHPIRDESGCYPTSLSDRLSGMSCGKHGLNEEKRDGNQKSNPEPLD